MYRIQTFEVRPVMLMTKLEPKAHPPPDQLQAAIDAQLNRRPLRHLAVAQLHSIGELAFPALNAKVASDFAFEKAVEWVQKAYQKLVNPKAVIQVDSRYVVSSGGVHSKGGWMMVDDGTSLQPMKVNLLIDEDSSFSVDVILALYVTVTRVA